MWILCWALIKQIIWKWIGRLPAKGLQELLANVFIQTNVERRLCPLSMAIVKNVKKISGNHFDIQNKENRNPSALDLWSSDPTMNRGYLLVMRYHLVKYENLMIDSFQNISGNYFDIQCQLDLWPNDHKIRNVVIYYSWFMTNLHTKYDDVVIDGFQDN